MPLPVSAVQIHRLRPVGRCGSCHEISGPSHWCAQMQPDEGSSDKPSPFSPLAPSARRCTMPPHPASLASNYVSGPNPFPPPPRFLPTRATKLSSQDSTPATAIFVTTAKAGFWKPTSNKGEDFKVAFQSVVDGRLGISCVVTVRPRHAQRKCRASAITPFQR